MNKIIAFSNQKGGCGKSTLCLLFANYLHWKKRNVCVIDTDTQQSLVLQRKDDQEFLESEMPFSIQGYDRDDIASMEKLMENARDYDGYVLIDCPGNMKDDMLIPILTKADYIICPFRYDQRTLTSTGAYVQILRELWKKLKCREVPIFFVPNNIVRKGSLGEKKMWREVAHTFSMLGTLTEAIPGRAALEKVNTYEITPSQRDIVENLFNKIIKITEG